MKLKFKRIFAGIMAGTMVVAMGVPTLPTIADDLMLWRLCVMTLN